MKNKTIEERYREIEPSLQDAHSDHKWVGRTRTWELFQQNGATEADTLRDIGPITRDANPALFDLLMEAFPATSKTIEQRYWELESDLQNVHSDYKWIVRLRTWEMFQENGQIEADLLRSIGDVLRHENPGLYDLVMEAFPGPPT